VFGDWRRVGSVSTFLLRRDLFEIGVNDEIVGAISLSYRQSNDSPAAKTFERT
jgi:hypothetical protein